MTDLSAPSDWALVNYRLHIASFRCTHCSTSWRTSTLYEEYLHRSQPGRKRLAPVLSVGIAPLWDIPTTISNDELKLVPACHECVSVKGAFTQNRQPHKLANEAQFRAAVARAEAARLTGIKPGPRIASTRKEPTKKGADIGDLY